MPSYSMSQMERELEEYVDRFGLANVVDGLARVASEKADHIRASYDDSPTASTWERAARALSATESKLYNMGL